MFVFIADNFAFHEFSVHSSALSGYLLEINVSSSAVSGCLVIIASPYAESEFVGKQSACSSAVSWR